MTRLSLAIPPRHGEPDAAYYADVCAKLQPHSWYDYRFGQVGTAGYVPMIWWLRTTEDNFVQGLDVAAAHHEQLWLLGNEPEMNGVTPEQAARAVREWQQRMGAWAVDYAACGVNISLHRIDVALDWLFGYLSHGGPVPPTWHIHIYGNADQFDGALGIFERWTDIKNVRRPIIVSEFASTDEPAALMWTVEDMLRTGRLRAAYWFSAYWADWPEPSLLTADGELTEIGEAWMAQGETVHLPIVMSGGAV